MKRQVTWIIAWVVLLPYLSAQQAAMPDKIAAFGPIEVRKPVLLDSVNLKDTSFSDEALLSSPVTFPGQERFTIELLTDTTGFFYVNKPECGMALHLFSIYLTGDRYGKGQLTVTSPNPLEVWIDGAKKCSKTQREDSLHLAGKVTANIEGFTNSARLIVKLLASAEDRTEPAFKIEVKPEKADSLLIYSFNNLGTRRIDIKDILEGKRVSSSTISPSGRFVLLSLRETLPGGSSRSYTEVYDAHQKRTILSESSNRAQLAWMPKQDLLYFTEDDKDSYRFCTLNPLTMEVKVLAEGLPKERFWVAPDEQSLFFSSKESLSAKSPGGLKRLIGIDDRQASYRDRYFIYRYSFDTGLTQQLTFGRQTASLNDISDDMRYLLFSTSK